VSLRVSAPPFSAERSYYSQLKPIARAQVNAQLSAFACEMRSAEEPSDRTQEQAHPRRPQPMSHRGKSPSSRAFRRQLLWLPDAPVAQPYALIVGSVCGAAVGTGVSFLGSDLGMAVLAMIAAFLVISLIHPYRRPGVAALASIPVLLHPGHWFPLLVVLPFTAAAVGSATAMSKGLAG
jgi:HPP family